MTRLSCHRFGHNEVQHLLSLIARSTAFEADAFLVYNEHETVVSTIDARLPMITAKQSGCLHGMEKLRALALKPKPRPASGRAGPLALCFGNHRHLRSKSWRNA
jgi:hypothetical protein